MSRVFAIAVALSAVLFVAFAYPQVSTLISAIKFCNSSFIRMFRSLQNQKRPNHLVVEVLLQIHANNSKSNAPVSHQYIYFTFNI